MTALNFDANEVAPVKPNEPVPTGKYLAKITESEMKITKKGNGRYLQLTFEISDGEYAGRLIWARLNLENPNPQVVAIGRAELSAICRAVGVMQPSDTTELHELPMEISVRTKKRRESDELVCEIKRYAKKQIGSAASQQNSNTPVWKR